MTEPQPPISSKPPCSREDALLVVKRLRESGHVAYFAGGCVRDELLGIQPKDYDVATDAPPPRVRELFKNTQAVGAAFGVILVRQGKSVVEVATFRTDDVYLDGRRPSKVHFATAEEDAKRRDFTINGLFLDPIENRVIDYVGGQEDLKHRTLRAIGDPEARFHEDHLRLLRAVRFSSTLEFDIEEKTAEAIRRQAEKLTRISPERIADELRRMFRHWNAGWAWISLLCRYTGLSDVIFRFLGPPPELSERNRGSLVASSVMSESWPFGLCLAAMALDWLMMQNKTQDVRPFLERQQVQRAVRALRQSLRISNDEEDQMIGSLEGLQIVLRENPPRGSVLKRFLARPTSDLSRILLGQMSPHLGLDPAVGVSRCAELKDILNRVSETDYAPTPLITGDDLTAAGLKPGKTFKRILDEVYDAQLESRVNSKDEAMQLALKIEKAG